MVRTYRPATIWLHWIAAALIVALAATGKIMTGLDISPLKAAIYRAHGFTGVAVLFLTLLRIAIVLGVGHDAADPRWPAWMIAASRLAHYGLYALLLALSGSGIATMALSGLGDVLLRGALGQWPDLQAVAPANAHHLLANIFLALLALHVAAALYHQYWRRDAVFARIWPSRGGPRT